MNTKVSRELKFRAWNKYGMSYFTFKEVTEFDGTPGQCKWPEATEIMQWTGRHDKNGREIYEGDICWTYEHGIGNLNRVVEFKEGSFVFTHNHMISDELRNFRIDYVDVLGNIYEHPNLLSQ